MAPYLNHRQVDHFRPPLRKLLHKLSIRGKRNRKTSEQTGKLSPTELPKELQARSLCENCASIDWHKVFSGEYEVPAPVIQLDYVSKDGKESSCPLCRLIADIVFDITFYDERKRRPPGNGPYLLMAISVQESQRDDLAGIYDHRVQNQMCWHFFRTNMVLNPTPGTCCDYQPKAARAVPIQLGIYRYDSDDTPTWCLVDHGAICLADTWGQADSLTSSASGKTINPSQIDYQVISDWVQECRKSHPECRLKSPYPTVPHLRLINCTTGRVEFAAEDTQYVALSYVIGSPDRQTKGSKEKPLVIRDAMHVVLNLGYKYLWVDKYCIPQDEETIKEHLKRMCWVYNNAIVTIIAAAGADSSFGLPGISKTPRNTQPAADLGTLKLVSTLTSYETYVAFTKWISRGWTYQEGVCSQRSLIFGREQVYYECNGVFRRETITLPWNKQGLPPFGCGGYYVGAPGKLGVHSTSVHRHIELYTRRDLFYESDALNAIIGILNIYDSKQTGCIWGLPVTCDMRHLLSSEDARKDVGPGSLSINFGDSLSWLHPGYNKPRRSNFPTWSWTSISGPKLIGSALNHYASQAILDPELNVGFELEAGRLISLEDYIALPDQRRPQLSCFMHLTGWTVDISPMPQTGNIGDYVKLSPQDNTAFLGVTSLDKSLDVCLDVHLDVRSTPNLDGGFTDASSALRSLDCKAVFLKLRRGEPGDSAPDEHFDPRDKRWNISSFLVVLAPAAGRDCFKRIGWAEFNGRMSSEHLAWRGLAVEHLQRFFQKRETFRVG